MCTKDGIVFILTSSVGFKPPTDNVLYLPRNTTSVKLNRLVELRCLVGCHIITNSAQVTKLAIINKIPYTYLTTTSQTKVNKIYSELLRTKISDKYEYIQLSLI